MQEPSAPRPPPDRHFGTEHLRANLRERSVRGGALVLGAQSIKFALQVGSTMILARLLTPRDFGLIGMVTAITGFLALFKDLGLSRATVQREEITQGQVSALFWINVLVSLVLTLLTAVLAPLVSRFYGEPRLTLVTLALAAGFLFGGLSVQHQALLQRQMRFRALAAVDVGSLLLGILAAVAVALGGSSYWALVAMPLVTVAAATAGYWTLCRWRPGRPAWSERTRSMLGFGGNLTAYNVINYAARNGDNLLIGRVWGAGPLGLYTRAYQLLLLPVRQVNAPVASVAVPAMSRLVGEPVRYRRAYLRFAGLVALVTMPAIALLAVTSDWVVRITLGPGWQGAVAIFTWLSIAALVQPVANTTGWLFITQDRTREMLHWGVIGGSLALLSFIAGLPWGAVGVAAAYACTDLVLRTPILFWLAGRHGPVRPRDIYRTLALPGLVACAVLAAVGSLRLWGPALRPLPGLLLSTGLAAVASLALLLVLPAGRDALAELRRLGATVTQGRAGGAES